MVMSTSEHTFLDAATNGIAKANPLTQQPLTESDPVRQLDLVPCVEFRPAIPTKHHSPS